MKSLTLFAVAALLFSSGCLFVGTPGSGVSATETRTVSEFHAVAVSGSSDVNISIGDETSVTVTCDDNLLESIRTEVVSGKLKIWGEGSYSTRIGVTVDVIVPSLDEISVSGSADVVANGIKEDSFKVSISGSGDAKINGEVDSLDLSISGSGNAELRSLKAKSVQVQTSGSGDATVFASESVDAKSSGSSDIKVHGKPADINQKTSGSGDIVIDA